MKRDKYFRARGGTAKNVSIECANCGELIFEYQKDGIGMIRRCYLNRIISPIRWANLQYDMKIIEPKDLPSLVCDCGEVLGNPIRYQDGRLAYRMKYGKFKRKIV